MLYYRDIIINKEKVVLAGNQRTTILKEIITSSPMDWMIILQENEKWQALTEKQRDVVIDYWKKWIEDPIIDVTEIELNEEEEKDTDKPQRPQEKKRTFKDWFMRFFGFAPKDDGAALDW